MSNDLIIGWCGACSFMAMAEKRLWWSGIFMLMAAGVAAFR